MKRILILFLFVISNLLIAQDSTNSDDSFNEIFVDFIYKSNPIVEINYGFGIPTNKNITESFANVSNWNIKLGKSEQKEYGKKLVEIDEKYVFGSFLSSSVQNEYEIDNKITTETYRFGFGSLNGIGFGSGNFSLIPYVSQDLVWTKLSEFQPLNCDKLIPPNMDYPDYISPILDNYLGSLRFGDKSAYGIKLQLASMIQLNANYETSVVYRRHLFWYWSGSVLLSQAGYHLLSEFTDEMVDKSPVIGTIFNFALKAGYQYGYYLLRKSNMNWPFNESGNEAPLTFETFNFGIGFVF